MTESAINTANISVSQPVSTGGIIFRAPKGTALPTDASTALEAAYESLGDIGEDGFTESTKADSNDFKDMAGNIVLSVSGNKSRSFKTTFIEAKRVPLLKFVYGDSNVEVDDTTSALKSVNMSNADQPECIIVAEELMSDGTKRRTVFDRAKASDWDDVDHQKGKLLSYGMTIKLLDNGDNSAGHIYFAAPANA